MFLLENLIATKARRRDKNRQDAVCYVAPYLKADATTNSCYLTKNIFVFDKRVIYLSDTIDTSDWGRSTI